MNQTKTPTFIQSLLLCDYLLLGYGFYLILFGIIFHDRVLNPGLWLSLDSALIVLLLMVIERNRREPTPFYSYLHFALPLLSYGVFYSQSALWDNVFFRQTFDPLLQHWDRAIFGLHLNEVLAPAVNNILVDELMHFFYFAYYIIIFLPATLMFFQRNRSVFELVFTLTFMYYIHYLFFMFFPGDGPLAARQHLFTKGYVFIPLMDAIYSYSGQQGGGAFPSTHVTSAIIVTIYTFRNQKSLRSLLSILCCGIIVATVYCSYHYAVDSLVGIFSGILFYFIGSHLYRRWRPEPENAFYETEVGLVETSQSLP